MQYLFVCDMFSDRQHIQLTIIPDPTDDFANYRNSIVFSVISIIITNTIKFLYQI